MSIDIKTANIEPVRLTFDHLEARIGKGKSATRYQEAVHDFQMTQNFHYRPTWDPEYELFDASRSKVVLADWYVLKDPRQFYYGTWTMARARQQDAMESSYQFVESRDLINKMPDDLRDKVCQVIIPLRHVAWGGNMNNCMIAAYGYGTAFTAPASLHAMDELGVAQYITRLGLALDEPSVLDAGKEAWLKAPQWQALRHLLEDSFVVRDPFEIFVAQNLAIDGLLYPLIFGHFIDDHVALNGGTAVSMLSAFMVEWHEESNRWVDAVVKTAAAESEANKTLINEWTQAWSKRMHDALVPISQMALGDKGASTLEDVLTQFQARCKKLGLSA